MPRELTVEFVLQRAKAASPPQVVTLVACSVGIENVACLQMFPNMRVCSLSDNNISELTGLGGLPCLEDLYLRKNAIRRVEELAILRQNPRLRKLGLSENPVSQGDSHRLQVIAILPQLQILDDRPITEEERRMAASQGRVSHPTSQQALHPQSNPRDHPLPPESAQGKRLFQHAGMNVLEDFKGDPKLRVDIESRIPEFAPNKGPGTGAVDNKWKNHGANRAVSEKPSSQQDLQERGNGQPQQKPAQRTNLPPPGPSKHQKETEHAGQANKWKNRTPSRPDLEPAEQDKSPTSSPGNRNKVPQSPGSRRRDSNAIVKTQYPSPSAGRKLESPRNQTRANPEAVDLELNNLKLSESYEPYSSELLYSSIMGQGPGTEFANRPLPGGQQKLQGNSAKGPQNGKSPQRIFAKGPQGGANTPPPSAKCKALLVLIDDLNKDQLRALYAKLDTKK